MADELLGLRELKIGLDQLGKAGTKIVSKALRDGAKLMQAEMVASAPTESGTTKANIKVRAGKKRKDSVSILVGLSDRWWTGPTWYAAAVEYGHHAGKRQFKGRGSVEKQKQLEALSGKPRAWIPGTHWMEKAFNRMSGAAAEVVKDRMTFYLEEAVASAAKGKEE